MGVNKFNSLMKEVTETAVISVKTNYVRGKHQFKNYMIMMCHRIRSFIITGHKNLQSINN